MFRDVFQPVNGITRLVDRLQRLSITREMVVALAAAAVVSCGTTFFALMRGWKDSGTIYWLLNLDLILLLMLGAVIARHAVRLWSERKRGVAGARLHTRLVVTFGVLAALPAILMAIFSALFLYFGMQAWFNTKVSTAVHESLEVAKAYLNEHQQVMRADALAMANDLNRATAELSDNPQLLKQAVQTQSFLRNLPEALVIRGNGEIIASSGLSFSLSLEKVTPEQMAEADRQDVVLITGNNADRDRIRALVKLERYFDTYLYVGRLVDGKVINHIQTAETAVEEYSNLDGRRSQIQVVSTLVFIGMAMLLLMAAVWFGLTFSEQLAGPIRQLIFASERVSAGDLGARVPPVDQEDEIGLLGQAFNRMTEQLQNQQRQLLSANHMLDQRRRFTEAVLSGASSGVIGLDRNGVMTLANLRARELLTGTSDNPADITGQKMAEFLPEIGELHAKLLAGDDKPPALEIEYAAANGPRRTLLLRLIAEQGGGAAVATIDDISALVSAQRSAAWADVARRIAHEIKNPLTPIQLSAERLNRKYLPQIQDDPETFSKCVETIIRQVQDIGHLVNEFSSYARMPVANKKHENMADICKDALILQKQAYTNISFDLGLMADNIPVLCDRSQMAQVITNLLQNAIDSVAERALATDTAAGYKGRIDMRLERRGDNVAVTVTDNGLGLPEKVREQLMEPYVTTKKKGSGLGLAIVKKIMEDHGGSVVLEDNIVDGQKSGARAVMVFPAGV